MPQHQILCLHTFYYPVIADRSGHCLAAAASLQETFADETGTLVVCDASRDASSFQGVASYALEAHEVAWAAYEAALTTCFGDAYVAAFREDASLDASGTAASLGTAGNALAAASCVAYSSFRAVHLGS
jgi:hypothetical protein